MGWSRRIRSKRFRGLLAALVAIPLVVVVALGHGDSSSALSGTSDLGHVNLTVSPTTGLTDGQAVTVHAAAISPTDLFDIDVHLCMPGAMIATHFDWSFSGTFCSPNKVSPAADVERELQISPGTGGAGDVTFKVGIGTGASWPSLLGTTQSLTCDSTHPCDLVVQLQTSFGTGTTEFFTAPLTFAATTPTTTTTTAATTTTTTAPTTTTTAPTTTTTTAPTTTTTAPTTTTTTAPTTTTTTAPTTTTTTAPTTTTTTAPTTTTTTAPTTTTTTAPTTTTTTIPGSAPGVSDIPPVSPGGPFAVTSSGWLPGSPVGVEFHSKVVHLGSLVADSNGKVSGQFTVPNHVRVGRHELVLIGRGANGQPQVLIAKIRVFKSECDSSFVRGLEHRYDIEFPEHICKLLNDLIDR